VTVKSEKISTQAVLRGYMGIANGTDPNRRRAERDRVLAYWPDDLLRPVTIGVVNAPAWRMLLDPTEWRDVDPTTIHGYVRTYLSLHGKWPSLDTLRRLAGRVSNHRGPDEIPGQESLL
jgi:hypothetical protein